MTASTDADGAAGTGMTTSTTVAGGAKIGADAVTAASATALAIGVTADAVGFTVGEGGADATQTEKATNGCGEGFENLATRSGGGQGFG